MKGSINLTAHEHDKGTSLAVQCDLEDVTFESKACVLEAVVQTLHMTDVEVALYAMGKMDGVFDGSTKVSVDTNTIRRFLHHED